MFLLGVVVILSYLIGAIPTSLIVSRAAKGIDIRQHGSGNAGGTNVWRILGWKFGLLVIVLDALKGVLAVVLISRIYYGNFPFNNLTPFDDFTLVQLIAGITAVLGHVWSVFASFKGGKGIATGMGILVSLATVDLLVGVGIFFLAILISRYVSLGSILAAISIPLTMIIRENVFHAHVEGYGTLLPFLIGLAVLVVYTHRKNISRISLGIENKISFAKKKS